MSVAYPNQNPVGPNTDSFSGNPAFSFEQQNPTQMFGALGSDPQSQMQTQMQSHLPNQSLSVPMVQVSQVGFSSDYDMGNAPRDEDFDVDLDLDTYDEDGDVNIDDLATPMATAEDDLMDDAANVPAQGSLFGQPGPSGQYNHIVPANDEEMADDALGQIVNEVMTDADQPEPEPQFNFQNLQQFQQQQLQQAVEQPLPQFSPPLDTTATTSNPAAQEPAAGSPVRPAGLQAFTSLAEDQAPRTSEASVVAGPNIGSSESPLVGEPVQPPPPTSEAQPIEEPSVKEGEVPKVEGPEPTQQSAERATPPPPSSLHEDVLKTPQAINPNLAKHQTPPSPADALRISQADTVPLENPTPDVGQRDWYTLEALEGQVHPSGSPHAHPYEAHQEIPTSPLQGPSGSNSSRPSFRSDHEDQLPHSRPQSSYQLEHNHDREQDRENEAVSKPSQDLEEVSQESGHQPGHEGAHEETHEDSQENSTHEDLLLNHPVIVVYRDTEFSLFPALNEKPGVPETSFLPDRTHIGSPLSKLVAALRDVLGEEFNASEELILNFTSLGVEFEEENKQMNHFTLYDLVGLFSKLLLQDGIDEAQPLLISLSSRKKYIPKLEMIHHHIIGGGGLAAWKSTFASPHNQHPSSQHEQVETASRHEDNENRDTEKDHQEPVEKNTADNQDLAENDDELELEEFEKDLGGDHAYDHEVEETNAHPESTTVATVDVPESPPQASSEIRNSTLYKGDFDVDASSHVTETQLSERPELTPTEPLRPVTPKENNDSSQLRDDEPSFVTAQEKEQENSVVQSNTASRSYGFIENSDEDEPNDEDHKKDDDELNFDDQEDTHDADKEEEDSKSSSTLHEAPEDDTDNHATFQGTHDGEDHADWNEWTYGEGDEEEQDNTEQVEHSAYLDAVQDLPEHIGETVSSAADDNNNDDFELDPNEFAYYPLPYSDLGNEDHDDEALLGLEQHETLSTTMSTKRVREDDDDEEEDEQSDSEEVRRSPPASKKHKTL